MDNIIDFSWKRKKYTAIVQKEHQNSGTFWLVEIVSGGTYLLSKETKGWRCGELNKELCRQIGSAIEAKELQT